MAAYRSRSTPGGSVEASSSPSLSRTAAVVTSPESARKFSSTPSNSPAPFVPAAPPSAIFLLPSPHISQGTDYTNLRRRPWRGRALTRNLANGIFSEPPGRLAQRESAAFTRQRSLVRTQHRPLSKPLFSEAKHESRMKDSDTRRTFVAATRVDPASLCT